MFCRKCGAEIPDNSKFCIKCGTKVDRDLENQDITIATKDPNKYRKKNKLAIDFSEEIKLYTDEELKKGDVFEPNIKTESENDDEKNNEQAIDGKNKNTLGSKLKSIFKNGKNKKSKKSKNKKSKNKKKSKGKKSSKNEKSSKAKKKANDKKNKKIKDKKSKAKKTKNSKKSKSKEPKKVKKIDKSKGSKGKRGFLFFGKKKADKTDKDNKVDKINKPKSKIKKLLILLIILIILGGGLVFAYFKFGTDFFADANAKKILAATYDEYYVNYDKAYIFPEPYMDPGEKYLQEKYNYSIDYAKGGLINEDILGSLKGIGIEIDRTSSYIDNSFYEYAKLYDNDKNKISAELSNDSSEFKLYVPEFYDKVLIGSTVYPELEEIDEDESVVTEEKTFSSSHDEFIGNREKWANTLESLKSAKYSFESPISNLIASNLENVVFEISEKNDDGKATKYTATLDGSIALTNLNTLLTAVDEDDNIALIINNIKSIVSKTDALKDTELGSGTLLSGTVANFSETIGAGTATAVEIELNLNDSLDALDSIRLSTILNNLDTVIDFDFKDGTSNQNVEINLNFSDSETEIGFKYILKSVAKDNVEYVKNENLTLYVNSNVVEANNIIKDMRETYEFYSKLDEIGEDTTSSTGDYEISTEFKLTGETIYNVATGDYSKEYYFDAGNFFDMLKINYKDEGVYTSSDTSKAFKQIIELNYDTIFYKYDIIISGNIDKDIVEEIGGINASDDYNLDFVSKVDYNSIKETIDENWDKFLDEFSSGEW